MSLKQESVKADYSIKQYPPTQRSDMEEIFVKKIKTNTGIDYIFFEHGQYSKPLFILSENKLKELLNRIIEESK